MNATATLPAAKSFLEFNMKKTILITAVFVLVGSNYGFAGEWNKARDLDVDKQLGEIRMASTILPPGKHENSNRDPKHGTIPGLGLSDAGATAKGSSAGVGTTNIGLGGGGNLDAGSGTGGVGDGTDANLNVGAGGDAGDLITDTTSDFVSETPLVGGDISTGDEYLINVDASVGETEVNANLIPSDSFDDTLIGQTTDIGAEIDASGELAGSEADIGIEADVDGSVSGDDLGDDPADGLSSLTSPSLL